VTLTGAGGSGKTRLALQVARRVAATFPDGVWFADLSSISHASLVSTVVLSALGSPQVTDATPASFGPARVGRNGQTPLDLYLSTPDPRPIVGAASSQNCANASPIADSAAVGDAPCLLGGTMKYS
jgi:hypothetical protein